MKNHLLLFCAMTLASGAYSQPGIPADQYITTALGHTQLDASKGLLQTEIKGCSYK
jgi:hypothetical protein